MSSGDLCPYQRTVGRHPGEANVLMMPPAERALRNRPTHATSSWPSRRRSQERPSGELPPWPHELRMWRRRFMADVVLGPPPLLEGEGIQVAAFSSGNRQPAPRRLRNWRRRARRGCLVSGSALRHAGSVRRSFAFLQLAAHFAGAIFAGLQVPVGPPLSQQKRGGSCFTTELALSGPLPPHLPIGDALGLCMHHVIMVPLDMWMGSYGDSRGQRFNKPPPSQPSQGLLRGPERKCRRSMRLHWIDAPGPTPISR